MHLKFNETSEVNFKYPKYVDHQLTPMFSHLTPGKLLQIDPYGIFVINKVVDTQEGSQHIREITAYSREYEFAGKQVLLASGVYDFWNPADVENTVLGHILQSVRNWKVGSVSPTLIGKYRNFSETVDEKCLDFMLSTLQATYGCVFVFDTYTRTINAIDVEADVSTMPVYLSSENLVKNAQVSTSTDNIITKLYVGGAEGVDIIDVNPSGDNYIYNLDYAISVGDIPTDLATKWRSWQNELFVTQPEHTSYVELHNSALSRLTVEKATLNHLREHLMELDNTIIVLVTQQQQTTDPDTLQTVNQRLGEVQEEYLDALDEIQKQSEIVALANDECDLYAEKIASVHERLKLSAYFTAAELDILDSYFIEDSYIDDTFAVFDVELANAPTLNPANAIRIAFSPVIHDDETIQEFVWTDVPCEDDHRMAALAGGAITVMDAESSENYLLSASIISGTLDHTDDGVVCSCSLGSGSVNGESFASGTLTCTFNAEYKDDDILQDMEQHTDTITSNDKSVTHTVYYYTGSAVLDGTNASVYLTRNASDYQRYTVEQELYNCAMQVLRDASTPVYEFEIESGNLLFEEQFAPFRNSIQLGCGVYLNLNEQMVLTPTLLEMQLDYEEPENFKLIFSNAFRRSDEVASYKDFMQKTSSLSRTLQTNKYTFDENRNTTTWVKNLLESGYDAALTQILAGDNQIVSIDKAGIKVDSEDGQTKIYLNNGMIALYDKLTNTVRMGLGRFNNPATGTDFVGVLADIIGGTLLAGQNLIIECPDPNGGVMQFKVDSSGVIINGGRFYIHNDKGAFATDPNYGSMWGTSALFTPTDAGHIVPTCIDENGDMILDENGWPQNVNVWIGIDGKVYIRGNIYADNGIFNGEVNAVKGTFSEINITDSDIKASRFYGGEGSKYFELTSLSDSHAFWVGNTDPDKAKFSVTRDGKVTASDMHITGGSISWGAVDGSQQIDDQIAAAAAAAAQAQSTADGNAGNISQINENLITINQNIATNKSDISSANTAIKQAQADILLKADASTVDELEAQIIEAEKIAISAINPAYITETGITETTITAPTIVGGAIKGGVFFGGAGTNYVEMNANSGDYAFWAGSETAASAPFRVTRTGALYATGATITGNITANGLSVTDTAGQSLFVAGNNAVSLAGWTVAANKLTNGKINNSGFIGLYTSFNAGDGDYNSAGTYLGPDAGENGTHSTYGDVNRNDWRLLVGRYFGVSSDGYLYCSGAHVSGHITASTGAIGNWTISGGCITGSDQYGTISLYPVGPRYDANYAPNTWQPDWESVVRSAFEWRNSYSDANIKNSIASFDDRYETLFDNLSPRKYKYNAGTSDRYHTGFIAQEVVVAVETAGLTTKDFAGVVHLDTPNAGNSEWMLRRDEFVSLNTWQIQKLKQRVADLEAKVEELTQLCSSMNA